MTFGSLFAGIGGFDLGLERAGMTCKWQVEIDPFCRKVLTKHWPHVPKYEDVREVGAHNLERVDLLCGGFPCQDISYAGRGIGIEGERSGLWSEYARLIGELRPEFVLVENVPALLRRGLSRVLGDLAEIGFDAEWECLPAAAFGAPHIRDRVWILAYPASVIGLDGPKERFYADLLSPHSRRRETTQRGNDWELLELVGGVHKRTSADWWRSQSRVDRTTDGLSDELDRNRGLGNAVVPQIAEWLGRRILEAVQ